MASRLSWLCLTKGLSDLDSCSASISEYSCMLPPPPPPPSVWRPQPGKNMLEEESDVMQMGGLPPNWPTAKREDEVELYCTLQCNILFKRLREFRILTLSGRRREFHATF